MVRQFLLAKIHRATVTDANIHYEGSLTVDALLLEASGIRPYEKVHVVNVTTGARFETYVISGPAGSGVIALNGGAARLGQPGDLVIIMAYALLSEAEIASFRARVVLVDDRNRVVSVVEGKAAGGGSAE